MTTPTENGHTARPTSGLAGRTVAILEARRSAELAKLFEQRGATVYVAPAMREVPIDGSSEVAAFIDELCAGALDLVLFLTGVGVRTLFAAADCLGRQDELRTAVAGLPSLCRGPKPVAALRALGLQPTYTTPSPYTTQQVLALAETLGVGGKYVGLVLHGGPAPELVAGLEALGSRVRDVRVYQWALPEDVEPVLGFISRLEAGAFDAVAFTSASQVHNLFAIAEQLDRAEPLRRALGRVSALVAVGPVCAAALREYDVRVDVEPAEPKMGPMVLAVDSYFTNTEAATLPGDGRVR